MSKEVEDKREGEKSWSKSITELCKHSTLVVWSPLDVDPCSQLIVYNKSCQLSKTAVAPCMRLCHSKKLLVLVRTGEALRFWLFVMLAIAYAIKELIEYLISSEP